MGIRMLPRRTATATPLLSAVALGAGLLAPAPVFAAGASTARVRTPRRETSRRRPSHDRASGLHARLRRAGERTRRRARSRGTPAGGTDATCLAAGHGRQDETRTLAEALTGTAVARRCRDLRRRLRGPWRAWPRTLLPAAGRRTARHAWTGLRRTHLGRVLVRAATTTTVAARAEARRRRGYVP
ncbi:hypothetical protein [Streptomyces sp. NPDC054842]